MGVSNVQRQLGRRSRQIESLMVSALVECQQPLGLHLGTDAPMSRDDLHRGHVHARLVDRFHLERHSGITDSAKSTTTAAN